MHTRVVDVQARLDAAPGAGAQREVRPEKRHVPHQCAHRDEVPAEVERLAGPAHQRVAAVVFARAGYSGQAGVGGEGALDLCQPVGPGNRVGVDARHDVGSRRRGWAAVHAVAMCVYACQVVEPRDGGMQDARDRLEDHRRPRTASHLCRVVVATVVDHDDLVCRARLPRERRQAGLKHVGVVSRRYHHRNRKHCPSSLSLIEAPQSPARPTRRGGRGAGGGRARPREGRLGLALLRPEVDAGLGGERVDRRQLIGLEREVVGRREVVFELFHARGSDEHRGDPGIP
ncbi:MAG: hypothetical protein JWQ19_3723 [Subtercola sp.]|nr:hypothetical protein [Subtercola sp.]